MSLRRRSSAVISRPSGSTFATVSSRPGAVHSSHSFGSLEAPTPLERFSLRLRVIEDVRDLLAELPPVAQPRAPLGALVVSAEELKHARRVARAPRVLEQQRVKQVREILGGQAERAADPHA